MLFVETVSDEQVKKNRTILAICVVSLVLLIIAIVVFRKEIWEKLPTTIKEGFSYLYSLFIWNGVIRLLIEMFYPEMLSSCKSVQTHHNDLSKAIVPIVLIVALIVFFVYTFLHIEKHKEEIETKEY